MCARAIVRLTCVDWQRTGAVVHACDGVSVQPHTQVLCITTAPNGTVMLATSGGNATTTYTSSALLQPPIIYTVIPDVWSTSEATNVTITGDRLVGHCPCVRCSVPLALFQCLALPRGKWVGECLRFVQRGRNQGYTDRRIVAES